MRTAAVIPARNEAARIEAVINGTRPRVDQVIVINDGSDDATGEVLHRLEGIRVIEHAVPLGKAAALARGFEAALADNARVVVTLDGDGQHDPAQIPRLLAAARAFPDHLVLGARTLERSRQPRLRRFANRFADFWVSWASGQPVPDSQTGFRIYPRALLETVRPPTRPRHGFVFESQMLIDGARAGFPCVAVPVRAIYERQPARASHFRAGRDIWEIFWMIWWKILLRGLFLNGLWRSLRQPARFHSGGQGEPD